MGAADHLDAGFGHAEMPDLALMDQLLDRTGDILDGHVGIDSMLIEEVDAIRPQALQGLLDNQADAPRAAIKALGVSTIFKAELGSVTT